MEFELTKLSRNMSEMHIKFPVDVFNEELSKLTPAQLRDADSKPIISPAPGKAISIPHGSRGTTNAAAATASVVSTTPADTAAAQAACDNLTIGCRVLKGNVVSMAPKGPVDAMSTVLPYMGINVVERNGRTPYMLAVKHSGGALSLSAAGQTNLARILDGTDTPRGGRSSRNEVTAAATPFMRYESMGLGHGRNASTVLYNAGLAQSYSSYYGGGRIAGASLMSTVMTSADIESATQTQGNIFYVPKSVASAMEETCAMDDKARPTPWGNFQHTARAIRDGLAPSSYYRNRSRAVFGKYADAVLADKNLSGFYTRLSSVPVIGICGGLVLFINIIDRTDKFMPLPDTLDMVTLVTHDELGQAYMAMVDGITDDDIRLAFSAFKSVPVADLKPSALLPDNYKGDIVEFLASPVVMSMVKAIHKGWCYSDPAAADKEYVSNPPLQYRGKDMAKQSASLTAVRAYNRLKSTITLALAESE